MVVFPLVHFQMKVQEGRIKVAYLWGGYVERQRRLFRTDITLNIRTVQQHAVEKEG